MVRDRETRVWLLALVVGVALGAGSWAAGPVLALASLAALGLTVAVLSPARRPALGGLCSGYGLASLVLFIPYGPPIDPSGAPIIWLFVGGLLLALGSQLPGPSPREAVVDDRPEPRLSTRGLRASVQASIGPCRR